jgi:hypothetical protein
MSRFGEPDVRDPIGGSSQFKYYPYLLALSNPKKSLSWDAAARRGQIVLIAQQQVKTKPDGQADRCTGGRGMYSQMQYTTCTERTKYTQ